MALHSLVVPEILPPTLLFRFISYSELESNYLDSKFANISTFSYSTLHIISFPHFDFKVIFLGLYGQSSRFIILYFSN